MSILSVAKVCSQTLIRAYRFISTKIIKIINMITDYLRTQCKYKIGNLKKVAYLIDAASCNIHIDDGEAYADNLNAENAIKLTGYNIELQENTSYNDRFQFQKTVTVETEGYQILSDLNKSYYVVLEDENEVYWLVNQDFPSLVTYAYTLENGKDTTVYTFNSFSNFPTIRIDANLSFVKPCEDYKNVKITSLKMLEKKYSGINPSRSIIYAYSSEKFKDVEFNDDSFKLEEIFDGKNVTTTLSFNIFLDDNQSSWHYNLLEYSDNKYTAVINNQLACGFSDGLAPSYNVQGSSQNGNPDIVTITLTETSQTGSKWAEKWIENSVLPTYMWKLTKNWVCEQ